MIASASALSRKSFPDYAFYMPLKAGERVDSGQGKYVTPPMAAWNATALKATATRRDALVGLYVGNDMLAHAESLYDSAQDWAKAWPGVTRAAENADTEDGDSPLDEPGEDELDAFS